MWQNCLVATHWFVTCHEKAISWKRKKTEEEQTEGMVYKADCFGLAAVDPVTCPKPWNTWV